MVYCFSSKTAVDPVSQNCPFDIEIPGDYGYDLEMVDGVMQITSCRSNHPQSLLLKNGKPKIHPYPDLKEFFEDQNILLALSTHGPM